MAKGATKQKKGAKKGRGHKTSMFRSVADKASCTVTRTLTPVNANQMYAYDAIRLADYTRASGIAQYYQRFRITGVTLTWKPVFDTYALNVGAPAVGFQKPNLYYIIDKNGSLPDNVTLEALKQSGAKVRALDEKPVPVHWKPAVLEENQAGAPGFAGPSGYKTSPWLSTNQQNANPGLWVPNSTNHQGIKFYIEQSGNGGSQYSIPFPLDITVEFEFIKPMIGNLISSTPALGLSYAELDNSPDGIVGGSDGITSKTIVVA